jgi:signal transduction histidine kinase
VNNAKEAMPQGGGDITIVATADGSEPRACVTVRIIDEGSGIDPTIGHKVFEPFFTTKVSGTGLGLSICREIAEFHRASLTLTRRPHVGTVAEVRFSAVAPRVASLDELGSKKPAAGQANGPNAEGRTKHERGARAL